MGDHGRRRRERRPRGRRCRRGSSTSRPTSSSTAARGAVRRGRPALALTEYGRAKAEAERRVARGAPGGAARPHLADLRRPRAVQARARGERPRLHLLHERDPQPGPGRRPRARAPRARCARRAGPLHVAGADAVSRADFAELIVGMPVAGAPAPATARSTARSTRPAPRPCSTRGFAACARSSASALLQPFGDLSGRSTRGRHPSTPTSPERGTPRPTA